MDSEQLLALAVRVEQASGADRELDLAVFRTFRTCSPPEELLARLETSHGKGEVFHDSSAHETGYCLGRLPAYTASLDAAMTLVPEGLKLRMGIGALMGKYSAVTEIVRGNAAELLVSFVGETVATADAATPAMALTAASLRALAASMKDGTHVGN